MRIEIEVALSKAYYQEYYGEWLTFRSKRRKWQPLVGATLIVWGVLCAVIGKPTGNLALIPMLFVGAGIYELGQFYYAKWQWLRARADSRLENQRVRLIFTEQEIMHTGPFSKGELSWAGLRDVKETSKGIFLIPESGISIYVPKQAFESATQVQVILSRAKQELSSHK